MDGIGEGLEKQGWYPPSGGNGPVAEMDGTVNGWVDMTHQIAVGPHDPEHQWPIGEHPQMDYGTGLAEGTQMGDTVLSAVRGWDTDWHAEHWGGDSDLH